MRKLSFIIIMLLLVIASCTKKSAPTTVAKSNEPAIDGGPIYTQQCARCHGATGVEGRAPNLALSDDSKNEIADKVTNGAGRMPAFASKLSAKEIDAVAEFVIHLRK